MKFIKKFNEDAEYQQFKETDEYILPNVSYTKNSKIVYYNPFVVPKVICTYNVTGTTSATKLCDDVTVFTSIEIDDVMMDNITTGFTFDSVGEHTVKFELAYPTTIGNRAFYKCKGLTSVVIPYSVISIGESAFYDCSGLTSVEIGSGVTSIDYRAFYYCISLTSVIIPDSVTEIGNQAFQYCGGLTSVVIPNSVTSIGDDTFNICSGLTSIVVKEGNTVYDSRENCNCIIETSTNTLIKGCDNSVIPNSVTSIGNYAFRCCRGLTGELVIPNSVTNIGNYAFDSCSGLTGELVIPDSITTIGENAFSNCSGLTSVEIGSGVTSIGRAAFNYCIGLTGELVIPNLVTSIGDYAFYTCSGLTGELVIPNSVTSIGSKAFYYCFGLTGKLVIGSGVASIGDEAFKSCSRLTSLEIGSGVTSIGNSAFGECRGLTEIVCYAPTAPTTHSYAFSGIKRGGVLKVPAGSNYSSWMDQLNILNWTIEYTYTPQICTSLTITADDVNGRVTTTTIYYTAITNGIDLDGNPVNNITITGTAVSAEFPQNTSETDTVERTITFEYLGATASTVITQGVWVNQGYTVDLNNQWQLSTTISNPDSAIYDGVYESFSNKGVDNSTALMYIDIIGYTNFSFYVRSYAESSYDYLVVSNLDCTLTSGTTSGANVKMTTKGKQNSGTAISDYQLVEFTGIDGDEHRITVMYRKDNSTNSGDDRGYVIIPKI